MKALAAGLSGLLVVAAAGVLAATAADGAAEGRAGDSSHADGDRGAAGTGQDPLTGREITKAAALARSGPGAGTPAPGRDVRGGSGPEPLYTERHQAAKHAGADSHRRADVYLYDYGTDTLIRRVVDLTTGRVEQSSTRRGVQLPPSARESEQAVQIILADPRLGPGLRTTYRSAASRELTSPAQLRVQGMAFRAAQAVGLAGGDQVAACGTHRCVQLFVRIPGGRWVDTSRIVVDLSARRAVVVGR